MTAYCPDDVPRDDVPVTDPEDEFLHEIAYQEVFYETHVALVWPVMLEALKRMHPSDLRMIITVGLGRVPSEAARTWLALIGSCLLTIPPRPEVVDYYDGDRRMATAVLLAEKSGARR